MFFNREDFEDLLDKSQLERFDRTKRAMRNAVFIDSFLIVPVCVAILLLGASLLMVWFGDATLVDIATSGETFKSWAFCQKPGDCIAVGELLVGGLMIGVFFGGICFPFGLILEHLQFSVYVRQLARETDRKKGTR